MTSRFSLHNQVRGKDLSASAIMAIVGAIVPEIYDRARTKFLMELVNTKGV
jgi:hypothetical protein